MILIPQYRTARRAAASGATPITVNQEVISSGGSGAAITFTGVVAGELLVVIAVYTSTKNIPSGYSETILAQYSSGNSIAVLFSKTASGSEGSTGSLGIPSAALGYRLSHGTISSFTNTAASATSISAGSSAMNPPAGSILLAAVGLSGTSSAPSANNSFSIRSSNTRGIIAKREYASSDTAQNCTLSWTTARNAGSFLALISP